MLGLPAVSSGQKVHLFGTWSMTSVVILSPLLNPELHTLNPVGLGDDRSQVSTLMLRASKACVDPEAKPGTLPEASVKLVCRCGI